MPTPTSIKAEKIANTIQQLVQLFQSGDVPKAIAIVTFPPFDVPSNRWSLCNRLIMLFHGTSDARGFQQWKSAHRNIKKGEHAFHILVPRIIKKENGVEKANESLGKPAQYICAGFLPIPVFSVEQTDGEPLAYQKIELPTFPLLKKHKHGTSIFKA
jgi:hypothetical protein